MRSGIVKLGVTLLGVTSIFAVSPMAFLAPAHARIVNYKRIEGKEMVLGLSLEEYLKGEREYPRTRWGWSAGYQPVTRQTKPGLVTSTSTSLSSHQPNPSYRTPSPLSVLLWLAVGIIGSLLTTFVVLPTLAGTFASGNAVSAHSFALRLLVILAVVAVVPLLLVFGGATAAYILVLVTVVSTPFYSLIKTEDSPSRIAVGLVR